MSVVAWTPEGRRLLAGSQIGEFTLWNDASVGSRACTIPQVLCPLAFTFRRCIAARDAGTSFNFETILQAHDTAIRALVWSHNENWLISGATYVTLSACVCAPA